MIYRKLLLPFADPVLESPIELVSYAHTTFNGAIPTHQSGDLIVAVGVNFSQTDIDRPSGWSTLKDSGGNFSPPQWWSIIGTKTAASSSETASWTNAEAVTYVVLRNHVGIGNDGDSVSATSDEETMPATTLNTQDGTSFVLQFAFSENTAATVSQSTGYYLQTPSVTAGGLKCTLFYRPGRAVTLPASDVIYTPSGSGDSQCIMVEVRG